MTNNDKTERIITKMINGMVIATIMVLVCALAIAITELHIQNWLEGYEDKVNAKIVQIVETDVEEFNIGIENGTIDAEPISEEECKAYLYDLLYE